MTFAPTKKPELSILSDGLPGIPAFGSFPGLPSIPFPQPPPTVGTGPLAARMGDTDPHPGAIAKGSPSVFVERMPLAALNDPIAPCGSKIATGCSTVFVHGKPVSRIGDATSCGAVLTPGPKPAVKTHIGKLGDETNKVKDCLQQASNMGAPFVLPG
jgi:uncharacterized Zn-binding protein involved in type VI secretion